MIENIRETSLNRKLNNRSNGYTHRLARWFPFLIWGNTLSRNSLASDFLAGLTGAVIVLPQGVAYALIAGLPPEYGLYTAIITPIIAGLFGSSLHLISGPTAAISIVVLSVISNTIPSDSHEFIPAVLTLTLLAGVIQFGLGVARLGTLVNFISHTVVIGFTAGAAILIATSQIKYAMGVIVPSGMSFLESWIALIKQASLVNPYALTITVITIISTLIVRRLNPKLPSMLIGISIGSVVCWLIDGAQYGVALVGGLSGHLPEFSLPNLSINTISSLLPGAMAVAILGLVEAVSIARAIAIRSGQRIDGNQEFVGQGLSNIIGSFFSCYAGSGSFTRTGINYESGAKTPMAAVFAALVLVLILLFIPDITSLLPLPAMAGSIILIAINLVDIQHINHILRSNKHESSILVITFISTLLVELEFAIYFGVILSLLLYLRRTSRPKVMEVAPKALESEIDLRSIDRFKLQECPQLKILRIDGSIFFGAVDHIQRSIQNHLEARKENQLLLVCSGVNFIDISGAEMLINEALRIKQQGGSLSICALKNTVKDELELAGYINKLNNISFYDTIDDAFSYILPNLNKNQCNSCEKIVFRKCKNKNRL